MIVPRNMLNPTLQPVGFGLLPEFATIHRFVQSSTIGIC